MPENQWAGGALLGAGAGIVAALLTTGKLQAAEGSSTEDILNSVAQAEGKGLAGLESAINRMNQLLAQATETGGERQSIFRNPKTFTAFRFTCIAANIAYVLPDREVPYKMSLVVKALPTNAGVIYVAPARADAANINSSYSLIANEAVELEIQNAKHVYISATVAGEGVTCIVEQRGGG